MPDLVAALLVLGGVLPIAAVVWGIGIARSEHADLLRRRQEAIDNGGSAQAMINAGLPMAPIYGDVNWHRVDDEIQRRHLVARGSFDRPVILGAVGILLSTVGGVWSLYL